MLTQAVHQGANERVPSQVEYDGTQVGRVKSRNNDVPMGGEGQICCDVRLTALITITGTEIDLSKIESLEPPPRVPTVFDNLLRLDSLATPGISLAQFLGLFTTCKGCQRVMTKRIFMVHDCIAKGRLDGSDVVAIDLTGAEYQ